MEFGSESDFVRAAGAIAARWHDARCQPLVVGLTGELGTGKSTWARAMLRGLGYAGRVPSPTYTLLEYYALDTLTVVHLDLYRLAESEELEYLGIRDWLARDDVWLLVEWPERAQQLDRRADVAIRFSMTGPESRRVALEPRSEAGRRAVAAMGSSEFEQ